MSIILDMISRGNAGCANGYDFETLEESVSIFISDLNAATNGKMTKLQGKYVNSYGCLKQIVGNYEFTVSNCYMSSPAFINGIILMPGDRFEVNFRSRVLYENCVFESKPQEIINLSFDNCIFLGDDT